MRNDRERTLHRNMLFPLALRHDSGSILPNLAEFENRENPEPNQVDNFSNDDGEVYQPVYEGPQTQSCTRKLMKANCLMADLFDIETGKICDDVSDVVVTVSKVNDKWRIPFIARQDFWLITFLVGEVEIVQTVSVLELNQEPSNSLG